MYYIYILYSASSDLYYIGYSNDPLRRVKEHNTKPYNTFTSKHRPWVLKAYFKSGGPESEAMRIERFIKKQKSRKLIERLCDPSFVPTGILAQLVRIPQVGINQRVPVPTGFKSSWGSKTGKGFQPILEIDKKLRHKQKNKHLPLYWQNRPSFRYRNQLLNSFSFSGYLQFAGARLQNFRLSRFRETHVPTRATTCNYIQYLVPNE